MNKAWTFLIEKELSAAQIDALSLDGNNFVQQWTAHEQQLLASFSVFKNRIIIVKVNEEVHGASGCSIDKLLRFVKDCEAKYNTSMLNRLLVAYQEGEEVRVVHSTKIKELLEQQQITENTIIYNTSVSNDTELNNWEQRLKNTWLAKYLVGQRT